jgi:hypothetical protein
MSTGVWEDPDVVALKDAANWVIAELRDNGPMEFEAYQALSHLQLCAARINTKEEQ